jgi:hypothetical protein
MVDVTSYTVGVQNSTASSGVSVGHQMIASQQRRRNRRANRTPSTPSAVLGHELPPPLLQLSLLPFVLHSFWRYLLFNSAPPVAVVFGRPTDSIRFGSSPRLDDRRRHPPASEWRGACPTCIYVTVTVVAVALSPSLTNTARHRIASSLCRAIFSLVGGLVRRSIGTVFLSPSWDLPAATINPNVEGVLTYCCCCGCCAYCCGCCGVSRGPISYPDVNRGRGVSMVGSVRLAGWEQLKERPTRTPSPRKDRPTDRPRSRPSSPLQSQRVVARAATRPTSIPEARFLVSGEGSPIDARRQRPRRRVDVRTRSDTPDVTREKPDIQGSPPEGGRRPLLPPPSAFRTADRNCSLEAHALDDGAKAVAMYTAAAAAAAAASPSPVHPASPSFLFEIVPVLPTYDCTLNEHLETSLSGGAGSHRIHVRCTKDGVKDLEAAAATATATTMTIGLRMAGSPKRDATREQSNIQAASPHRRKSPKASPHPALDPSQRRRRIGCVRSRGGVKTSELATPMVITERHLGSRSRRTTALYARGRGSSVAATTGKRQAVLATRGRQRSPLHRSYGDGHERVSTQLDKTPSENPRRKFFKAPLDF